MLKIIFILWKLTNYSSYHVPILSSSLSLPLCALFINSALDDPALAFLLILDSILALLRTYPSLRSLKAPFRLCYPEFISGFSFALLGCFLLISSSFYLSTSYLFYQALSFQLLLHLGLGSLLFLQGKFKLFTKQFIRHGFSARLALIHWIMMYSGFFILSYASALLLTSRFMHFSLDAPKILAFGFGFLLILRPFLYFMTSYYYNGLHGLFYHYFFIIWEPVPLHDHFTLSVWGLALISQHSLVWLFATFSQCFYFIFIFFIVRPYQRSLDKKIHQKVDDTFEWDSSCIDEPVDSPYLRLVKTAAKSIVKNVEPKMSAMVEKTKVQMARLSHPYCVF